MVLGSTCYGSRYVTCDIQRRKPHADLSRYSWGPRSACTRSTQVQRGIRWCKAKSTSAALERRGGRGPNMDKQALCRAAAPGTHHTSLLLHSAPILPHESRHAALSTEGKPLEPMPPRGRFHTGTGDSPQESVYGSSEQGRTTLKFFFR